MGMKFEYKGVTYDVPGRPKREWKWMLNKDISCKTDGIVCGASQCLGCVYSRAQGEGARKAFYYECFPEEKPSCEECTNYKPKEEPKKLPKLTQEVFEREDCPEWAKWAAVDKDGRGWWFEDKPFIPAIPTVVGWASSKWKCREIPPITAPFDATIWGHSLIEREIKYVSCSSLKWPTLFKYSKLKDTYYVQIYEWAGPEWHIVGTQEMIAE